MKKAKFLSLILVAILLISTFSTTVFALNDSNINQNETYDENECNVITEKAPEHSCNSSLNANKGLYIFDDKKINVTSSSKEIIDSIISTNDFKINGTVIESGKTYNINEYCQFDEVSRFEIAKWAKENNLITELEMINCYCDLFINRNFENILCLNSAYDEIENYSQNNFISSSLATKIDQVNLSLELVDNNDSGTTRGHYSSEHFELTFSDSAGYPYASQIATFLEQTRTAFINMGFAIPLLYNDNTKYSVYVHGDAHPQDDFIGGLAQKINPSSTSDTCAGYIHVYYFSTFNDAIKSIFAHEYFHLIQYAYNHHSGAWFNEGFANWGALNIIGKTTSNTFSDLANFIKSSSSIEDRYEYGNAMFGFGIQRKYGTAAIVSIYEALNGKGADLDEYDIIDVITEGIQDVSYSGTFEEAVRFTFTTFLDPEYWYSDYLSDAYALNDYILEGENIDFYTKISTGNTYTVNFSIDGISSKYYKIESNSDFNGATKIAVDLTGGGERAIIAIQAYLVNKNNNNANIVYSTTSTKSNSLIIDNIENYSAVYFVITGLEHTQDSSFSAFRSMLPSSASYTFAKDGRHKEFATYIAPGGYSEVTVTFAKFGQKIFQTFGSKDVKLELYTNGTKVLTNDDSGYSTNAFIAYSVNAGQEYKLRVYFYSAGTSGEANIGITQIDGVLASSSTSISKYEDIYKISNTTSIDYSSVISPDYSKMILFTPPSSGEYTIELLTTENTYLYVIDPRSAAYLKNKVGFDDNSGTSMDAKITTTLTAGIPYLIIYSLRSTGSITSNVSVTVSIDKK